MSQWCGTGTPEIIDLRKKVANFGKQVASEHGDKDFPDWLNFKIGIAELKGIPYDKKFYNDYLEPKCSGGVIDSRKI
jgi:hypothetical protein